VQVLRTWVRTPLSLRERNATDFIPIVIHPRELNNNWLSKANVKPVSTELALVQKNVELEKENKQLIKEVLEQKLLLLEYKSSTKAKLEESKVRKEKLIKSNEKLKQEMKQQAEETQRMMKQMIVMFQKQVQP